jgi:hypothetical protein
MTPIRLALVLSCAAFLPSWAAQAQDKPLTAQQERMKSCNAEARDKHMKGDERRDFMSHCLKGESGERDLTAQQEKMVTCNREASAQHMKGEDRRSFMSQCLRGDKHAPAAAGR